MIRSLPLRVKVTTIILIINNIREDFAVKWYRIGQIKYLCSQLFDSGTQKCLHKRWDLVLRKNDGLQPFTYLKILEFRFYVGSFTLTRLLLFFSSLPLSPTAGKGLSPSSTRGVKRQLSPRTRDRLQEGVVGPDVKAGVLAAATPGLSPRERTHVSLRLGVVRGASGPSLLRGPLSVSCS